MEASSPALSRTSGSDSAPGGESGSAINAEERAPRPIAFEPQDLASLKQEVEDALSAHRQVGQLNASGGSGYWSQKVMRRSLNWYTAPIHLYQGASIRALQRLATISHAHENSLDATIGVVEEIRSQNAVLANAVEEIRGQNEGLLNAVEELRRKDAELAKGISTLQRRSRSGNLLRENDKIIDYWDNAALTDPMRETVTQGADESDEEYQQNWVNVGEYVAGKIMSHSSPNPVALEVGPGMGRITIPMSKYCSSITAIDISPEMAQRARQAMAELKNFNVQVITDEDLSFLPSEHFDLAYAISCFQHAEKKSFYRYLEGMRRALKPGGTLFFGVLNLCSEAGWGHFAAIVKGDYPEYFHTPDEISCYLRHAGYSSHELAYERETLWAIAKR
jgi:SAM-dependent methyltransferase